MSVVGRERDGKWEGGDMAEVGGMESRRESEGN